VKPLRHFIHTEHQLCFVHPSEKHKEAHGEGRLTGVSQGLNQIKQFSANFEEPAERSKAFCERYQRSYPYYEGTEG